MGGGWRGGGRGGWGLFNLFFVFFLFLFFIFVVVGKLDQASAFREAALSVNHSLRRFTCRLVYRPGVRQKYLLRHVARNAAAATRKRGSGTGLSVGPISHTGVTLFNPSCFNGVSLGVNESSIEKVSKCASVKT